MWVVRMERVCPRPCKGGQVWVVMMERVRPHPCRCGWCERGQCGWCG